MKLDSHLVDTASAGVKSCEGAVEAHVDAAVIGGAFTGLTAPLARGSCGMQKATGILQSNMAEVFPGVGNARSNYRRTVSSTGRLTVWLAQDGRMRSMFRWATGATARRCRRTDG
ncbi:hypothetical protein [Paraburkholderia tuberum]|uniref:hypothetical protein n=1 Tax=Paraburkholderia tuberum TaxID=157910 RepID=UPI000B849378|nr:hypothetical protein [Paraburkholderia tuberum]